jgi:4-amino-4-deoxychorismate lyase
MESALRAGSGAQGLRLIETLRWQDGPVRGDLHLARLADSAARLGWPCDISAARLALARAGGPAACRLRLTLDAQGALAVEVAALPPRMPVWRVGLAKDRLQADDPWLGVKSTRRAVYDAARADLPPDLDERLFLNERGEVCDGTITTVFFDAGDGLCTPPLTSGLLPGVLRAAMLRDGCVERVLRAKDLPHVRLWLGNSLRGMAPAVWSGAVA